MPGPLRHPVGKLNTTAATIPWGLSVNLLLALSSSGQPSAPTGLTATMASSTQINLAWTDRSANELGFRIEQSPDTIVFSEIGTTPSNVTTFSATNLSPAIKYYFRVRAYNGAGNSAYSNTNSAVTRIPWLQWQLAKFTPQQLTNPAVSGLDADPDADGLVNLLEHGLDREPFSPNGGPYSSAGIETHLTDRFLLNIYARSAAALDVKFSARVFGGQAAWLSGPEVVSGPIPVATNAGRVTEQFRAIVPVDATPSQLLQLNASYSGVRNSWETGTPMPYEFVEMTAAWLGDNLYVTGMTNAWEPATTSPMMVYNIISNSWTRLNPDRPFKGNHHAAEVLDGRLYLVGGCDGGSDGKLQVYDPATNGWSLGAPLPFAAGSCASAVINGRIYAAGGIVGEIAGSNIGYNTNAVAVYDPASNAWTRLAPLTVGMNHTASATDGLKFYVFGGRAVGNKADNGYNTVQIYDPASDTWACSSDAGSSLAPLPQARGGMGKAIYSNGDFFVMGGETVDGDGATVNRVYNRVDIYSASSNTWRLGTPMPTARHGIYPAVRGDRVYVAGGGVVAGVSYSSLVEVYLLP